MNDIYALIGKNIDYSFSRNYFTEKFKREDVKKDQQKHIIHYEFEHIHYPTPFRETLKDLWEYAKDNPLVSIGNCRGYVFGDSLFDSFDSE